MAAPHLESPVHENSEMKIVLVSINIVLFASVVFLLVERARMQGEVLRFENEVRTLSELNTSLSGGLKDLQEEVLQLKESSPSPVKSASEVPESGAPQNPKYSTFGTRSTEPGRDFERVASWRAKEFVTHVSDRIALSAAEQEALASKFQEIAKGVTSPTEQERTKVIEEVLGTETFGRYEEAERERRAQEKAKAIDEETVVLARKLSLSPQQEASLRTTLEAVEVALQPKRESMRVVMREAMANHFGGEEAKGELKAQYDTIQILSEELKAEKDRLVFEALDPVLSDQQKNALLESQVGR